MDTDDLSTEAYEAIIITAERFNHDLTLQFGLLSYECENEMEYLKEAKRLIEEIRKLDRDELADLFFGSPPIKVSLDAVLDKILSNITEVERIPGDKRHYNF